MFYCHNPLEISHSIFSQPQEFSGTIIHRQELLLYSIKTKLFLYVENFLSKKLPAEKSSFQSHNPYIITHFIQYYHQNDHFG